MIDANELKLDVLYSCGCYYKLQLLLLLFVETTRQPDRRLLCWIVVILNFELICCLLKTRTFAFTTPVSIISIREIHSIDIHCTANFKKMAVRSKSITKVALLLLMSIISQGALAFQFQVQSRDPFLHAAAIPASNGPSPQKHQHQLPGFFQRTTTKRVRRHSSITILSMASSSSPDNNSVNQEPEDYQSSTAETCFSWLMITLPFVSVLFPFLLEVARSQPPGSGEQLTALTALFASNRFYLYAMSTTIVGLVALRSGGQDSVALGQRVVDLTEELLYSPPLTGSGTTSTTLEQQQSTKQKEPSRQTKDTTTKYQSSAMIQNLSSELGDSLDDVSSGTQAIVLPVLVSALFASSFFFVKLLNGDNDNPMLDAGGTDDLANLLQTYGPVLSTLWNGLIITLFTRCEVRRLLLSNNLVTTKQATVADTWLPWIVGATITALAFGGVWQAQNFANMALAVLVARAIQINNLPAILGALSLLTLYDATSVLFLPANAALVSDALTTTSHVVAASSPDTLEQAAKSSAMGAVAIDKLTSGNFQPGLLVTKLEGRIGGALGLGDAVFPSLLATMARRFDLAQNRVDSSSHTISLFVASMVGYIAGCLACEVVPFLSTSGVPALLLIVPFMVGSTLAAATFQGSLNAFWKFEPESLDVTSTGDS